MSAPDADVRDYYENEARLRLRQSARGQRAGLRHDYLDLLHRERRTSVIDFGSGPGGDGEVVRAAGYRYVGVDLAHGNARLAAEKDLLVLQGSVTALPIRSSSFDAGWSLSTLMHLPEPDVAVAVEEMLRVLRPDALLLIGLWGRESEGLVINDTSIPGSRRPFHLRSFDRNRQLLTPDADLEVALSWEAASEDWDYHVFRLRKRA